MALGINATVGNSGVGLIQLPIPFIIAVDLTGLIDLEGVVLSSGQHVWLTNVPLVLALAIAFVCVGITLYVSNGMTTWLKMVAGYALANQGYVALQADTA